MYRTLTSIDSKRLECTCFCYRASEGLPFLVNKQRAFISSRVDSASASKASASPRVPHLASKSSMLISDLLKNTNHSSSFES